MKNLSLSGKSVSLASSAFSVPAAVAKLNSLVQSHSQNEHADQIATLHEQATMPSIMA
jgi:hypothetical protein